jgi:hypothetical protein
MQADEVLFCPREQARLERLARKYDVDLKQLLRIGALLLVRAHERKLIKLSEPTSKGSRIWGIEWRKF